MINTGPWIVNPAKRIMQIIIYLRSVEMLHPRKKTNLINTSQALKNVTRRLGCTAQASDEARRTR
jgi:hypothetical protein